MVVMLVLGGSVGAVGLFVWVLLLLLLLLLGRVSVQERLRRRVVVGVVVVGRVG